MCFSATASSQKLAAAAAAVITLGTGLLAWRERRPYLWHWSAALISTFVGMLLISLDCILMALARLRAFQAQVTPDPDYRPGDWKRYRDEGRR